MDNIAAVKDKINIVDLIQSYIPLKKSGKNYKANCPFHTEKTASFMVSEDLQIFRCFGCQKSGDIFRFVMEYEGVEFYEALKMLAEKAGVKLEQTQSKEKSQTQEIYKINNSAQKFYTHMLFNHPYGKRAMEYLLKRGIKDSTIKEFKLGYAPKSWNSLSDFLTKSGFSQAQTISAGLAVKGTKGSYDMFRGRIIFPLFDPLGKIIGFSARALDKDQMPKYINTPETEVFHKERFLFGLNFTKAEIRKLNEAIIVEGEFDMISPYQSGIKNIVASKGTALTTGQVNLIKKHADTVCLVFDNDLAGLEASIRGINIITDLGLNIKAVPVPEGFKDPDELALKDPYKLKKMITDALPIWDFYFWYASKKFNFDEVFEKKKASDFLAGQIKEIKNEVVKAEYLKKFAVLFDIDEKSAKDIIDRSDATASFPDPKRNQAPNVSTDETTKGIPMQEIYYLNILSNFDKESLEAYLSLVLPQYFTHPKTRALFELISENVKQNKNIEIKAFYDKLAQSQPDIHKLFEAIYLIDFKDIQLDHNKIEKEAAALVNRLKSAYVKSRLAEISKEMKKAEGVSNADKLSSLQSEANSLSKDLLGLST